MNPQAWLAVSAAGMAVTVIAFAVLAAWIALNGPRVAARWRAAVEAELAARRQPAHAGREES